MVVAWVASRQLGLITAAQLHQAGVGRGSIEWRLANGQLHRVFRGVYLVGHAVLLAGALELAAVLACGDRRVREPSLGRRALGPHEDAGE